MIISAAPLVMPIPAPIADEIMPVTGSHRRFSMMYVLVSCLKQHIVSIAYVNYPAQSLARYLQ